MVLKSKNKSIGGPTSNTKGPINKKHLQKLQKTKKLRQAIEVADTHKPQEESHEQPIQNTPTESHKQHQDTPKTKSNKRKHEGKTQHESTPKELELSQEINAKPTQTKQPNKKGKTKLDKEPVSQSDNQQQSKKQKNLESIQHQHTQRFQKAGEYYVLPFRFAKKGSVVRQLLVKHDTVNNVLRIINLSIGLDEAALEGIFSYFSPTKVTITREDNIPDATVVCGKQAEIEEFLGTLNLPIVLENNNIVTIDKMTTKPQKINAMQLQQDIDTFMHDYDAGVIESERVPENFGTDADGFKLAGVRSNLVRAEHGSKKEKAMEALQQKEKGKLLTNFYRFQKNEQFKAEQAELTKKLANEKKRIAQMAQQRKFKPF